MIVEYAAVAAFVAVSWGVMLRTLTQSWDYRDGLRKLK